MMQDRLREQFLRDQEALIEAHLTRTADLARAPEDLPITLFRQVPSGWWIAPAVVIGVIIWGSIGLLLAGVL